MATPKRPTPITERKSRADIQKAMENAERMETPHVTPEEGGAKRSAPVVSPQPSPPPAKEKKRVGRPPVKEGRTARLNTFLTEETKNRLMRATFKEKLSRMDKGEEVDQSLIVEEALESWLDQHNY